MNNPPAFPNYLKMQPQDGMTLRDYFAAAAMQGMLSDPQIRVGGDHDALNAKLFYGIDDAMLEVREA